MPVNEKAKAVIDGWSKAMMKIMDAEGKQEGIELTYDEVKVLVTFTSYMTHELDRLSKVEEIGIVILS